MRPRRVAALLLALTAPIGAQEAERLRVSVLTEQYAFAPGYSVESVLQLTMPVVLDVGLGRRASLVLSTGMAAVTMHQRDTSGLSLRDLSSPLDTEIRLGVQVVPGRLESFIAATLPTGRQTILEEDLSILAALANDGVGFSTPTFGTGGSVAGGVAGAFPIGRFAIGGAANVLVAFPYQPVAGEPARLSPGTELRVRLGAEGTLAQRTYLRVAGSLVTRQRDRLDGIAAHGLGRRLVVYGNLEHGLGPLLVGLHLFNVSRGAPQLESTAFGVAVLPRGNLLVGGVNVAIALGSETSVAPFVEYRVSAAAPTAGGNALERQASAARAGAELRQQLSARSMFVLRLERTRGEVLEGLRYHALSGSRVGLRVEVSP